MRTLKDDIDALLTLAESDPGACVDRCRQLISTVKDPVVVAHARRASGVAQRSLGQIGDSIESLQQAEAEYRNLGLSTEANEAKISLAPSIAISGDFEKAMAILEPICELDEPAVRSHAQVQLAGLVARTGEFDRALDLYSDAEPNLIANQDHRWLALLYSTRGLVQTYRSEFGEAEHDIRAAMTLFEIMDRASSYAEMLGNLGFMQVLSGDVAKGLATLLDAEQRFQLAGLPSEAISTARAYGYMLAGLPERAREVLTDAADSLHRQGRELEEGEARILAARSALSSGDTARAAESIDAALALGSMAERVGWQTQAKLIRFRAMAERDPAKTDKLLELAAQFEDTDNVSGAADALVLAAGTALDTGDTDEAIRLLSRAKLLDDAAFELPVAVRLGLAESRVLLADERPDEALAVLNQTADLIDRSRMFLSATESRTGLSRHSDQVAELGLRMTQDTTESIEWVERFRASALRIAPVVPNRNPMLAKLLADLRRLSKARDDAVLEGENPGQFEAELSTLESQIRDQAIADPSVSVLGRLPSVHDIQGALGVDRLLYVFQRGDDLMRALISADSVVLSPIGRADRVAMVGHHLLSSMRRAFFYPSRADPERTHSTLSELAIQFVGDLDLTTGGLVVVPPADLLALPWNAFLTKVTGPSWLSVAPSAATWLSASQVKVGTGRNVSVVAGPRLTQAQPEAAAIRQVHGSDTVVLEGDQATVEQSLNLIETSAIFHAVAHGRLRRDNPMFSSLELADGELSLYHLEQLIRPAPVVVLSACDSAHGSIVAGQELFGLTSVFLQRGTRSIVSTVAPIPDSSASVGALEALHTLMRDGADAPSALGRVLADVAHDTVDPALALVAYGAC